MSGFEIPLLFAATAASAGASIMQGQAQKQAADFNARVAEQNAVIARQQGQADAERHDRMTRLRRGAAVASAGGSGVTLDSFDDLLADSAMQEELDRLTIIHNADLAARGFTNTATLDRAAGRQAVIGGYTSAAGALLSGGSKIASRSAQAPRG